MPETPITPWWQQLSTTQSLTSPPHLFTLATQHPPHGRLSSRPAARTVNVRGMHDNRLYFVTDMRSQKAADATCNPYVELCYYNSEAKKQFRLSGKLNFHKCDAMAERYWNCLSHAERRWWTWPTPGENRAADKDFLKPEVCMPEHFCVGAVTVDYVDVLDLNYIPFEREVHELKCVDDGTECWTARRVNP